MKKNDLLTQLIMDGKETEAIVSIAKGADVNAWFINENRYITAPLREAVKRGQKDLMALLIAKGADINFQDSFGYTPLMEAVFSGNADMLNILIANGANLEQRECHGGTALICAAVSNQTKAVKLLAEKGADLNAQDETGQTALMMAIAKGNVEAVDILVKHKADLNIKNNRGKTALDILKANRSEYPPEVYDKLYNSLTPHLTQRLQSAQQQKSNDVEATNSPAMRDRYMLVPDFD